MSEEIAPSQDEVLKSMRDKLAELEDLQLVNKLDIINVKNDLDKASLSGGLPASGDAEKKLKEMSKLAEKTDDAKKADDIRNEMEALKRQIEKSKPVDSVKLQADIDILTNEISGIKASIAGMKNLPHGEEGVPSDDGRLEEIQERLDRLEKMKVSETNAPGIDAELIQGMKDEIGDIRRTVADLEAHPVVSGPASGQSPEHTEETERLTEEIDSLRTSLEEQKLKIEELGRRKPEITGEVPDDVAGRIDALEDKITELSHRREAELHDVPEDLINRVKMLEAAVSSDMDSHKKTPEKAPSALLEKIDALEHRLSSVEASGTKAAAKGKVTDSDAVEEVKNMLESVKASMEEQGKEIVDLRNAREGAHQLEKVDELESELDGIKQQIGSIEKNAASIGMAPDALEELRKMKNEFPVEKFHELEKKIVDLEEGTKRLTKLATALKPIELPKTLGEGGGQNRQMRDRLLTLEKAVGEGVSEKRFIVLEKKMEEMREWLPEYIQNDTKNKIEEFKKELTRKVHEMNDLKEEIVESTIEQLLAQPGNVSKLMGEKFKSHLEDIENRVGKLDNVIKPSDAKVTTLLRNVDGLNSDLLKLKESFKEVQTSNKDEIEALTTELKALNTRLGSFETSVKGVESSGITGIARDLEILKTKADWLESTIHKLDLDHIYQKIDDLEDMLKSSGAHHGPVVLD